MDNNRESFEAWAVSHGGLDLTMHEAMDNEKLPFMCTYYSYTTEIAWRAFANKKVPAQAALAQANEVKHECNEKSQPAQLSSNPLQLNTDSAREYLVENLLPKFSDCTFADYVRNKLAGDFAYQLAMYLQSQAQQTNADSENDWYNFNNLQAITNYLLSIDSFEVTHEDDEDQLGTAKNIIESFKKLQSQAQQPTVTDEMIAAAEAVEDLYRRGTPDTWKKMFLAMWREMPSEQSQALPPAPEGDKP